MGLMQLTPPDTFWIPLIAGAIGSLAVSVGLIVGTKVHPDRTKKGHTHAPSLRFYSLDWWRGDVYTESTRSFKDSWANNITGAGAVLGTVTSTSSLLKDVLPGTYTDPFVPLGIFLGGADALSPLIYAALAKLTEPEKKGLVTGSVTGLLISSTVTLFTVLGELAAVAVLVNVSTATAAERWMLISSTAAASVFVLIYAWRSFQGLVEAAPSTDANHTASFMNPSGGSATL